MNPVQSYNNTDMERGLVITSLDTYRHTLESKDPVRRVDTGAERYTFTQRAGL